MQAERPGSHLAFGYLGDPFGGFVCLSVFTKQLISACFQESC